MCYLMVKLKVVFSANLTHVILNGRTESCVSTNFKHELLNSKTESCFINKLKTCVA